MWVCRLNTAKFKKIISFYLAHVKRTHLNPKVLQPYKDKSNHNNYPPEADRQAEDPFDLIKYMQSIGNRAGTSGEL